MAFKTDTVLIGDSTKKSSFDQVLENTIHLKTSATQFTGEKTFQSATVFNATATFNSDLNVTGTATVVSFPSKRITSANYIHAASISQNDVYDKVSPFLPNIGDIMAISGGLKTSGALTITLAYVIRLDANTLRFSGYGISSGSIASADADDESATLFDDMSISW